MATMKFVNPTQHVIILDAIGLPPVGPKGTVEIPLEYVAPGRTDAGQRAKSAIESIAPQLEPADKEDKDLWLSVPAPPEPRSKIVSIARRAPDEAPGVKQLRELKAKQVAEAKAKSEAK